MALSTCCLVDTSKSIDAVQAYTLCVLRCGAVATVKFGGRNFADGRAFALARLYVYCYTFRNACASRTCAGYPGKYGTFRYRGSSSMMCYCPPIYTTRRSIRTEIDKQSSINMKGCA